MQIEQQQQQLWEAYERCESVANRNALVNCYMPLLADVAQKVHRKLPTKNDISIDDLISAGFVGLIQAIDKFDRDRGWKFPTFAVQRIRGSMLDWLRSCNWVNRCIAKQLNPRVVHLSQIARASPFEDRESGRDRGFMYIDEIIERFRHKPNMWQPLSMGVMKRLMQGFNQRERLLFIMYYMMEMTMKTCGEHLGLSESRVSQMHTACIARIRATRTLDDVA